MTTRHAWLPPRGTLLISTDLHGNGEDFRALRARFLRAMQHDPEVHWVVLGDSVHGPDAAARAEHPELYDYPDESGAIVLELLGLRQRYPDQVHYVLGNHDHAHIGGPRTRKFYDDEAEHLLGSREDRIGAHQDRPRAARDTDKVGLAATGGASIRYQLPEAAAKVQVTLLDASGRMVRSFAGTAAAGENLVAWDGTDGSAAHAPAGLYTVQVAATRADGTKLDASQFVSGTVQGIEPNGSELQLVVDGTAVPMSAVSTVSRPQ